MSIRNHISEKELAFLLKADPDEGIRQLHAEYADQLVRHIKGKTRGLLSPDELWDAYQDTLCAVISMIKKPDYDPHRPLIPLVFTIARNKGVDALRRRGHRVNNVVDVVAEYVDAEIRESEFACKLEWLDRKEFRETLRDSILELPPRQRLVAQAFVDNFEDFEPRNIYGPLTEAVNKIKSPDCSLSVDAVKSLWQRAREKLKSALIEQGYYFLERKAS